MRKTINKISEQDIKFCWKCNLVSRRKNQELLEKDCKRSSFNNGWKIADEDDDKDHGLRYWCESLIRFLKCFNKMLDRIFAHI